ncbi:(Fe-S)-binding protein [Helicobacter aurati]|uniref:(Fe-S)-binding protein n=1 Tax=Helicobacter aurati TaxID=137778 RepID=A0A3D8J7T3_9HELI|nr:(Fe-S)-binding protein [Helicobacter aurati]RDU72944.1 (Fe-S)-binding protein [Helicobacter aurati]
MSKVYFFATCLGSAAYADTCLHAIKLLQREGIEVIFKKDQTCCGQPSYNSGYYEETKKIALYHLNLLKENYPIIIPSGSCAGMMKVDYVELFEGSIYQEEFIAFSKRIYELSEYLDKVLNVRYHDIGNPIKITWHSNCHALRVAKCIPSAKNLLRRLQNVELIELEKEEDCCGFGGTFSVKEPEISRAMVMEKIKDIQTKDIHCLIAADAGCLLNISGAMAKIGCNIPSKHLYDFLAERVGIA